MTGQPATDVNANDVVAFLIEVAVLSLLGVAGWQMGGSTLSSALLAVALPGAAAVLWGTFAAPRALVESDALGRLTRVVVLGAGVAAGFWVLPIGWALAFAAVVLVNNVLAYVGPFARRQVS